MTTISPEKEALVKQAQNELATSSVSILDRKVLARRLEEITKEMLKGQKKSLKVQVHAAITLVETAIEQDPASTSFVVQLPGAEGCAKVISEAIKQVSSRHANKSTYFIGLDGAAGRVAHGCFVSQGHTSNGLVANEWTAQVAKAVGGKAGGKGAISIGSGTKTAKVEDGIDAAREYLRSLKI